MKDEGNVVKSFSGFIAECGFDIQAPIMDGKIHRFSVEEDSGGEFSGWYLAHADFPANGEIHNWRTGEDYDWTATKKENLPPDGLKLLMDRIQKNHDAMEAQKKKEAEEGKKAAKSLWSEGVEYEAFIQGRGDHPYVAKKGITGRGLRVNPQNGDLLIPIYSLAALGQVVNVQRVTAKCEKRYQKGAIRDKQTAYIAGDNPACVYVCEGYATGASINMATGYSVFCAMDCKHLGEVVNEVLGIYRGTETLVRIAGDDDRWPNSKGFPKRNAGRDAATEAGMGNDVDVAFPAFVNPCPGDTDFNDLASKEGLGAVGKQLTVKTHHVMTMAEVTKKAPKRQWIIKDLLARGQRVMLYGPSNVGKSAFVQAMALCLGCDRPEGEVANFLAGTGPGKPDTFIGKPVVHQCKSYLIQAENEGVDFKERLDAMCEANPKLIYGAERVLMDSFGDSCRNSDPLATEARPTGRKGAGVLVPTANAYKIDKIIREEKPDVEFLDPLVFYCGTDENDNTKMAQAMRIIFEPAEKYGTTQIVVHHSGKPGKNGEVSMRGASSIQAFADSVWQIKEGDDAFKSFVNFPKAGKGGDKNNTAAVRDKECGSLEEIEKPSWTGKVLKFKVEKARSFKRFSTTLYLYNMYPYQWTRGFWGIMFRRIAIQNHNDPVPISRVVKKVKEELKAMKEFGEAVFANSVNDWVGKLLKMSAEDFSVEVDNNVKLALASGEVFAANIPQKKMLCFVI